jgi:hypothetical protein
MDGDDEYRKQALDAQAWADRAISAADKRLGCASLKVGCH